MAKGSWIWAAMLAWGVMFHSHAANLNVTNYGAIGDAIQTSADITSNSTLVSLNITGPLSGADIGKLIELFGAGPASSPTNNQDLIASIIAVTNGNQAIISSPAWVNGNNLPCTYGTQNAQAFQNCVNACQDSNNVITIPPGQYLLVAPQILDPSSVMNNAFEIFQAVTLTRGGIQFQGHTENDTILLDNGAWVLNSGYVQRGILFGCVSPSTNDAAPLVFQNLTFDGGVQTGNVNFGSGPADPVTGSGWDVTHDAVVDMDLGFPPNHANKFFINCCLRHWRGEMVKSVVSCNTGFIGVTNCLFYDGDGSGFNFNWTPHTITGCTFSNLNMAMEYYVGTMQTPSVFENSTITNTRIGIGLVGGLTNHPSPGYSIISNSISATQYEVMFGPAANVLIAGNSFYGGVAGVATDGAGYQGSDYNHNILVENNQFFNTYYACLVGGAEADMIENMTWLTNAAWGCNKFAFGYGWSSNIVFKCNTGQGILDSTMLQGQWFIDDPSDNFPPQTERSMIGLSPTNTASYAQGMRYQFFANFAQGVFLLDNSHPQCVPSGAGLLLTNISQFPVTVYLTSTNFQGSPQVLQPQQSLDCVWSNSIWMALSYSMMSPPSDLRVSPPSH